MDTSLLDTISSPQDLKNLPVNQLPALCEEIRSFLIESVSKTGGHLSSNLGVIELTVALHRVFSTPVDKILFDVGHQCYTHKILTGRREGFAQLRMLEGLSGFPSPRESCHDAFIAGHGNTALSTAIGIARAKKLKHEPGKVIAVIGDGAYTGGMVYEGMNNIDTLDNLIVILNDNKMSISKNVGTIARHLTVLRTNPGYFRAKESVSSALDSIPLLGTRLVEMIQFPKMLLRRTIYHSTMFEEMGFQYIGPVDGHDVQALVSLFRNIQEQTAPLFIHAVTVKGKGFKPAEENPGEFHGVSAFDLDHITNPEVSPKASFSTEFGQTLVELGKEDHRICAITAAMKYGTGLQFFYHTFPERFFDVGMAEQHAVTFAAGLASQGLKPVVGLYSTFLQRSYDQIIHDVKLMDLNVVFAIDRAGFVPADGETHQGIYDAAFLSQIGIPVISPSNYQELRFWLRRLVKEYTGPCAIRYARGGEDPRLKDLGCSGAPWDQLSADPSSRIALVTYGALTAEAIDACAKLKEEGILCDLFKMVQVYPLDEGLLEQLGRYDCVLFAEEGIRSGGIGEKLAAALLEKGWKGRYLHQAVEVNVLLHATVPEIRRCLHLDADSLADIVKGVQL